MFWPRRRSRVATTTSSFATLVLFAVLIGHATAVSSYDNSVSLSSASKLLPNLANSTSVEHDGNGYKICPETSVRNNLGSLELLRNCSVIEGHLVLAVLLIPNPNVTEAEYPSFPELREISGSLVVYRCDILSLRMIFPNLAVIRGLKVFGRYSLVVFENHKMTSIGLENLKVIMNGDVRIERNPKLCFVHTIDWQKITLEQASPVIKFNQDPALCPFCPKECLDKTSELGHVPEQRIILGRCWNPHACQKSCTVGNTCKGIKDNQDCEMQCVGGCFSGNNTTSCIACRKFYFKGKCVDECPVNTFLLNNRRCVEEAECRNHTVSHFPFYKAVEGISPPQCVNECPAGYSVSTKKGDRYCDKCEGSCAKICNTHLKMVNSLSALMKLKGCTVIDSALHIELRDGEPERIQQMLVESLGMVEEINGYLKITRTHAIVTLHFFKNLRAIRNQANNKHAIFIKDNLNLEELFPSDNKTLKHINGSFFFYGNSRLCINKIEDLKAQLDDPHELISLSEDFVSPTNGEQMICRSVLLNVTTQDVRATQFTLRWSREKISPEAVQDHRFIYSYMIYYQKTHYTNLTEFMGTGLCKTNNQWIAQELEIPDEDTTPSKGDITFTLTNLEPNSNYGFYVFATAVKKSAVTVKSNISYIRTKIGIPFYPRNLIADVVEPNRIHVRWDRPPNDRSNYTIYVIKVTVSPDSLTLLNQDFCFRPDDDDDRTYNMHLNSVQNKTDEPPVNCKKCPCKADEPIEKEQDEREADIQFEDMIHDFIFKRRTVDSITKNISKRHTNDNSTAIENQIESVDERINKARQSFKEFNDNSYLNCSVPGDLYNYSDGTFACFDSVTESQDITGLKHFTKYQITVYPCVNCSDYLGFEWSPKLAHSDDYFAILANGKVLCCGKIIEVYARTARLEGADDIDPKSIHFVDNSSNGTALSRRDPILLKWDTPLNPNAFIQKYEIEYSQDNVAHSRHTICVSHSVYSERNGSVIPVLGSGNYSFKIRAVSSGGIGNWTETVHYRVKRSLGEDYTSLIISIVVIMLLLLVAAVLGIFLYAKRRLSASIPDKVLYASINPEYMSAVYQPDEYEVPREKVKLSHELGQGSFGMVYQGIVFDLERPVRALETHCAVKTVKEGATSHERHEFLQEATIMKSFDSYHVVKLLGVVSKGQPLYVIMELMANGDLKKYLRSHRPDQDEPPKGDPPTLKQVLQMAAEIADGMAYLGSIKFVHRDLAARNCMVAEDLTVKIGDFGMTRDIYETDYYKKGGKGLLPVRWMSPEALKDGVFTVQGDVWSYGVVLWEMVTLATMPYQGLSHEQVLKWVISRHIMERPENCPDKLYEIMKQCWQYNPKMRPKFTDIVEMLLEDTHQRFHELSYYTTKVRCHRRDDPNSDDRPGTSGEGTPLVIQPLGHMAPGGLASLMENPRRIEMGTTDVDEESNLYISDDVISDGEGEESGTENWDTTTTTMTNNRRRHDDIGSSLPKHNNSDYGSGKSPTMPLLLEERDVLNTPPRSIISSPSTISSALPAGDRRSFSETNSKGSKVSSNGSIQSNGRVGYTPMNNRTTAC